MSEEQKKPAPESAKKQEPKIQMLLNFPQSYAIHSAITCKIGALQIQLSLCNNEQESVRIQNEIKSYAALLQGMSELEQKLLAAIRDQKKAEEKKPTDQEPKAA